MKTIYLSWLVFLSGVVSSLVFLTLTWSGRVVEQAKVNAEQGAEILTWQEAVKTNQKAIIRICTSTNLCSIVKNP